MLDNNIHPRDIDIILTTHQHSYHVNGLGEFYYRRQTPTKLFYGDHPLNHKLVDYWKYLEREGVLKFETYHDFEEIHLSEKVAITPIELNHGFPTSGFIIKAENKTIAIITDTNAKLNRRTLKELEGVDYMFADAFSEDYNQIKGVYEDCNIEVPELAEEWFHMTIQEVIELHKKVKAKKTYTVHMSRHLSPHDELVQKYQSDNFIIGYDGLRIYL